MDSKTKILALLKENPNYSARVIGEKLGLHRVTVNKHIRQLGIKRDRELLRKCNNTNRSFPIFISENAEQIILGSILGDGSITKNGKYENSKLNKNSCLYIKHGLSQEEYAKYKYDLLEKEGIKCRINFLEPEVGKHYINNVLVKNNGSIEVYTRKCISFNKYRELFYNPIKFINSYINKLNALGLSIWFMDDGYKSKSGYGLCTNGFTVEDVNLLRNILKINFNIDTTLQMKTSNNKKVPLIYIRSNSVKQFNLLVQDFICESMKYKLITK